MRQLIISWRPFWKDFSVRLDGEIIGAVSGGRKELAAGREFQLTDQSILRIQLNEGATPVGLRELKAQLNQGAIPVGLQELNPQLNQPAMPVGLLVFRNGVRLPARITDPAQAVKTAYLVIFLIAGLNLVLGSAAMVLRLQALHALGIGFGSIGLGVIFVLLAVLTMRRSLIALKVAILLFVLDGALGVFLAMGQGVTLLAGELIIRLFLLVVMGYGVRAMKELSSAGA